AIFRIGSNATSVCHRRLTASTGRRSLSCPTVAAVCDRRRSSNLQHRRAVIDDLHEPRLKVKDEKLGTNSTRQLSCRCWESSRSHIGGQSPRRRLTSQRGRRSELYLPETVFRSGKDALQNRKIYRFIRVLASR